MATATHPPIIGKRSMNMAFAQIFFVTRVLLSSPVIVCSFLSSKCDIGRRLDRSIAAHFLDNGSKSIPHPAPAGGMKMKSSIYVGEKHENF